MPIRSRAEQAYLAIHKPDVLHKLASDSPIPKNLPYHVSDRKKNMSRLSMAQRRALPSSAFAVPSKAPGPGSYPIPDKGHAVAAKGLAARFGSHNTQGAVAKKADPLLRAIHAKRHAKKRGHLLRGNQGDTLKPGSRFDSAGDRVIGNRDVKGEVFR